jgi:hypothetical protein
MVRQLSPAVKLNEQPRLLQKGLVPDEEGRNAQRQDKSRLRDLASLFCMLAKLKHVMDFA